MDITPYSQTLPDSHWSREIDTQHATLNLVFDWDRSPGRDTGISPHAKDNVWTPAQNSQLQHGGGSGKLNVSDGLHKLHRPALLPVYSYTPYCKWAGFFRTIALMHERWCVYVYVLTFFLSLMEPLPLTMILHPVSASSCLAVSPRGPRIRPTKLNCNTKTHATLSPLLTHCM